MLQGGAALLPTAAERDVVTRVTGLGPYRRVEAGSDSADTTVAKSDVHDIGVPRFSTCGGADGVRVHRLRQEHRARYIAPAVAVVGTANNCMPGIAGVGPQTGVGGTPPRIPLAEQDDVGGAIGEGRGDAGRPFQAIGSGAAEDQVVRAIIGDGPGVGTPVRRTHAGARPRAGVRWAA